MRCDSEQADQRTDVHPVNTKNPARCYSENQSGCDGVHQPVAASHTGISSMEMGRRQEAAHTGLPGALVSAAQVIVAMMQEQGERGSGGSVSPVSSSV